LKKKKQNNVLKWILEHVRPYSRWDEDDGFHNGSNEDNNQSGSMWSKWATTMKEKCILGIKFRWRF